MRNFRFRGKTKTAAHTLTYYVHSLDKFTYIRSESMYLCAVYSMYLISSHAEDVVLYVHTYGQDAAF